MAAAASSSANAALQHHLANVSAAARAAWSTVPAVGLQRQQQQARATRLLVQAMNGNASGNVRMIERYGRRRLPRPSPSTTTTSPIPPRSTLVSSGHQRPSSYFQSFSRPFSSSSVAPFLPSFRPNASSSTTSSSTANTSTASETAPDKEDKSLTGRLRSLMKRYGWATVVVYLLFSVLDFSLVFFAINLVGAEHVRKGQNYVLDALVYGSEGSRSFGEDGTLDGKGMLGFLKDWREKHKSKDRESAKDAKKSGSSGSLWTTAVLAYGIHKTLLMPVRLGATAAATPYIVRTLQRWGINIARNPIPEATRAKGAKAIADQRAKLDKARQKHSDWL